MDATIIFPHQLFSTSDALKKSRKTFIIRDPLFFIDKKYPVRFHKNKILLHLLSTDSYKNELIDRGYDVQLVIENELIGDNYFDSFFQKSRTYWNATFLSSSARRVMGNSSSLYKALTSSAQTFNCPTSSHEIPRSLTFRFSNSCK